MRKGAIALLATGLLLLGPPSTSLGHMRSGTRLPRLRAVTKFVGRHPGSAHVYLPKDVDVTVGGGGDVDKQPPYDFRGNGRVIAFLLTQVDDDTPLGDGASLLAWSWGRCSKRACKARGFLINNAVTFGPLEERDDKRYLPAGKYEVFYVADGARTSFRLELEGLKGKRKIHPHGSITSELKTIKSESTTADDEHTYWGGRSTDLAGRGLSLLGFWMVGEDETVMGEAGYCVYEEKPDGVMPYMPPCPLADDGQTIPVDAGSAEFSRYTASLTIDQGMGAYYTTTTDLKKAGGADLWIGFE
jgi:hypothetical protein